MDVLLKSVFVSLLSFPDTPSREFHGQRSLLGYSPWGCKTVGHDLVTKQQQ